MTSLDIAYNSTLNPLVQKYNKEFIDKRNGNNYLSGTNNNSNDLEKFTTATFQHPTCLKSGDWLEFKRVPAPKVKSLEKFPNGNRNLELLKTINSGVRNDYYQFHKNDKCHIFPPQRLFNNITRRSCLPSPHFSQDIAPIYLG